MNATIFLITLSLVFSSLARPKSNNGGESTTGYMTSASTYNSDPSLTTPTWRTRASTPTITTPTEESTWASTDTSPSWQPTHTISTPNTESTWAPTDTLSTTESTWAPTDTSLSTTESTWASSTSPSWHPTHTTPTITTISTDSTPSPTSSEPTPPPRRETIICENSPNSYDKDAGNYGDLICIAHAHRSRKDVLLVRDTVINYEDELSLRYTKNFKNVIVSTVNVLNFGRQHAFTSSVNMTNEIGEEFHRGSVDIEIKVPENEAVRLFVEVYGRKY